MSIRLRRLIRHCLMDKAERLSRTQPGSQRLAKTRLIGVFVGLGSAGDDVGTGQPAVQVDVPAAVGTERLCVELLPSIIQLAFSTRGHEILRLLLLLLVFSIVLETVG